MISFSPYQRYRHDVRLESYSKTQGCEQEKVVPTSWLWQKASPAATCRSRRPLTTEEIYLAFLGEHRDLRTFFHGHTYTGNPLACAAAAPNIDLFPEGEDAPAGSSEDQVPRERSGRDEEARPCGRGEAKGLYGGYRTGEEQADEGALPA